MSIEAHIQSIAQKRAHIKQRIAEESSRPLPDFTLITNLKKQNLALKQEMQTAFLALKATSTQAS